MRSALLKGHILGNNGLYQGYVTIRKGVICDVGAGEPPSLDIPEIEGIIIPGLMNMHTHLGDCGARGPLPYDLASAVHPGGAKHRFLINSPDRSLISSYSQALSEAKIGSSLVLDFREGGAKGVDIAKKAMGPDRCVRVLGRPGANEDIETLLEASDGLGIPSLDSADPDHRRIARSLNRPYTVHASELYREDVVRVLELDPDLVIHMISSTEDDWNELSSKNTPICICPRANSAFGLRVPISAMIECGSRIVLGTDNSMAVRQDMFREMEAAYLLLRNQAPSPDNARKVFSMASGEPLSGTKLGDMLIDWTPWWSDGWPAIGDNGHLAVLKAPSDPYWMENPFEHVVRFSSQRDVLFTI
ncbi:MAG: amidohydrolase family protein [Candidatus Thermoplasmatota archaeon]|nr:amidohydrolase family protein [Candidatus Thermoplasmatota archaeon]